MSNRDLLVATWCWESADFFGLDVVPDSMLERVRRSVALLSDVEVEDLLA